MAGEVTLDSGVPRAALWSAAVFCALGAGAFLWLHFEQPRRADGRGAVRAAAAPAAFAGALALATAALSAWALRSSAAGGHAAELVHEGGLLVGLRHGRGAAATETRLADLTGLAFDDRFEESNGEHVALWRDARWWTAAAPAPVRLRYRVALESADPLLGWWQAANAALRARAAAALAKGGSFDGDGWSLRADELQFGDQTLYLDNLAAVELVDGQLSVWEVGREHPTWKLPESARNRPILQALLDERLPERPAGSAPEAPGLGRIIFQRAPSRGWVWTAAALGAACLIAAPFLFAVQAAAAAVAAGLAMLFLGIAWQQAKSLFRCHIRGVRQRGAFGERELAFDQVVGFTYSAVRHYHNGVYTGTAVALKFHPDPASGAKPLRYSSHRRTVDDNLEVLRMHVSAVVAQQLLSRFAEAGAVAWTPHAALTRNGLEYRAAKFVGRAAAATLPFAEVQGWNFDQGVLHVFEKGKPKAVFTEQTTAENFFPGLLVFERLVAEARPIEPEAPSAELPA